MGHLARMQTYLEITVAQISTDGEFLCQFEVLFTWPLIFYRQKPKQNNFRVFEELVFFDLWILVSGYWIPVFRSGFRLPVSGF